ncbi:glycosyltransferase [Selenomonas ruminantium]|nr:glycosyltransferase [Selenomonas ruminantium]
MGGFLDGHPIGAVGERNLMNHYQKQVDKTIDEKIYLFQNSWTDSDSCFNSGVLLMDVERLRNTGDILLPGLRFLVQHEEECKFFDQDILNYFFSRDYLHLPWNYNILQHWDRMWGKPELEEGIYHYMGRTLRLNMDEPRDCIFYEAFVQTPWCSAEYICKSFAVTRDVIAGAIAKNNELNRRAAAAWAGRRRVFVGPKDNEEQLREMFFMKEEEPYVALGEGWEQEGLNLPYDLGTHVYVFFLETFPELRKQLEAAGWREWEDFIDGKALILPHSTRLLDEYRIFMVM